MSLDSEPLKVAHCQYVHTCDYQDRKRSVQDIGQTIILLIAGQDKQQHAMEASSLFALLALKLKLGEKF